MDASAGTTLIGPQRLAQQDAAHRSAASMPAQRGALLSSPKPLTLALGYNPIRLALMNAGTLATGIWLWLKKKDVFFNSLEILFFSHANRKTQNGGAGRCIFPSPIRS